MKPTDLPRLHVPIQAILRQPALRAAFFAGQIGAISDAPIAYISDEPWNEPPTDQAKARAIWRHAVQRKLKGPK